MPDVMRPCIITVRFARAARFHVYRLAMTSIISHRELPFTFRIHQCEAAQLSLAAFLSAIDTSAFIILPHYDRLFS